jgi:Ca2+-binding RTX toxin-like protein
MFSPRSKSNASVPVVEQLESRRLYNGSATLVGTTLTVQGTSGNDTIVMGYNASGYYFVTINNQPAQLFGPGVFTAIVISGGQGNDYIDVSGLPAGTPGVEIHGGQGDDTLIGSVNDDTIYGGAGNDSIGGGAGDDWIAGGAGSNTLRGGAGNDTITAGAGSNLINGGPGDDTIYADNGFPDSIYGGTGNNTAYVDPNNIDLVVNATAIPPTS